MLAELQYSIDEKLSGKGYEVKYREECIVPRCEIRWARAHGPAVRSLEQGWYSTTE